MYTTRGITEEKIQSLEDGLGKIGLEPEDIEIVILTHVHWDHVGLASKLSKAKFIIQKAELEFARNPHETQKHFYDKGLMEGLNLEVIEGDRKIIDGVEVLFTPGHSPGGQSVVVDTPKGTAIITGFCAILDNFDPPEEVKGPPVIPPGIHIDITQVYDSVLKVKQMADFILPLHDNRFISIDKIPV